MPSGFAPPYSVAQTIQDILQQRRETSRQAMIDKLNEENVRSDIGYRKDQLQLQKDQQAFNERMKLLEMVPGGADPNSLDPEVQAAARRVGRIRQRPAQSPIVVPPQATDFTPETAPEVTGTIRSGVEQPFLPGREAGEEYVGNDAYQQRTRAQEDIDAIMGQFANDPDTLRALMMVRSGAASDVPASLVGPKPSFTPIDPSTLRAGTQIDLPRGGTADIAPHEPPNYFAPQFLGTDQAGTGKFVSGARGGGLRIVEAPGIGDLTRPGTEPQTQVPPALANRLTTARERLEYYRNNRGWMSFGRPSADETAADAEFRTALGAVFSALGHPIELQEVAISIAADPTDSMKPLSVLVQEGAFDPPPTPEEMEVINDMLNYARGVGRQ